MIKIFYILYFVLIMSEINILNDNSEIWKQINETTWKKDNNWAGEGYTFFETNDGIKRCVKQVYGSGVNVVTPLYYYKVEIKSDTIQLLFNIAASFTHYDYHIVETLILNDGKLKSFDGKSTFVLLSKTPIVYDFQEPSSEKMISIDELKKYKE